MVGVFLKPFKTLSHDTIIRINFIGHQQPVFIYPFYQIDGRFVSPLEDCKSSRHHRKRPTMDPNPNIDKYQRSI